MPKLPAFIAPLLCDLAPLPAIAEYTIKFFHGLASQAAKGRAVQHFAVGAEHNQVEAAGDAIVVKLVTE